ncbi:probable polygalacturonase At3g15720 [Ziziphus jujuba]|uniref:Probable polygalacturonase At3g15720 n=1 Tax=Ziziphus jujuba TaxID=326968 RepID=A0A6P3ZSQ6_ZIZJJ|nr:probable polygalacturonase At3g15720 [Ziziphus jujuba]
MFLLIFLFALPFSLCIRLRAGLQSNSLNVMDYGAVGDGQTDDSPAFLKAWGDLCGASEGTATLNIPKEKTFLLKPLTFSGPCNSSNINFQIEGKLVAPNMGSWSGDKSMWISFDHVEGLVVNGGGSIDGQGSAWWNACGNEALHFNQCHGLHLSDLSHLDSPKNHISLKSCNNVHIVNLHVTAPKESPNTDGIDISESADIHIDDSVMATGDDCIGINNGSSYINIKGITCGPGHGISVGSLGGNGAYNTVENVYVFNCTFKGTQNGARIKTSQGGSGYARNITFEKIIVEDCENPIIIDQQYDASVESNKESAVEISEVTYKDVHGSSADEKAIHLQCCESVGCTSITLDQINITSSDAGKQTYSVCNNVQGTATATNPNVPCLKEGTSTAEPPIGFPF